MSEVMFLEKDKFSERPIISERYLDTGQMGYTGLLVQQEMNPVGYKYP